MTSRFHYPEPTLPEPEKDPVGKFFNMDPVSPGKRSADALVAAQRRQARVARSLDRNRIEERRFGRRMIAGTAVAGLLGAGAYVSGAFEKDSGSEVPERPAAETVVVVEPGATAWGIAEGVTGGEGEIRNTVDSISEQANEDGNPGLQAGERLTLNVDPATAAEIPNVRVVEE